MSNENRTQALDDLDCMLTQFENSFDKENILKKDAIIESTKNNSPLLTNNLPSIKTKAKNSLLLLHKKSKSLYNLANCSTPKVNSLEKEIEYLNVLNETGQLNDSVHESPKLVSPIIRCTSSQNQITLSNESLNTPKSNTVVNLNQLGEGLNRKIKFDDETGSETGSQKDQVRPNRLETVNEDEEILANLNETEDFVKKPREVNVQKQDPNRNLNEAKNEKVNLAEKSGFQTASGKILMYNKENVMREDVETSSLKDTLDKSECKIDNLLCSKKDDVVNEIPSKISIGPEKNSVMEISGFQTASGKSLLFRKDNILKDIETKMEIDSQKESLSEKQLGLYESNGKELVSTNSSNEFLKKSTTQLSGFQTASGKSLLYKKDNIIKDDSIKNESECQTSSSIELSGFQTASGKGLMYKKDFILKEQDVQDECDKNPSLELSGFKTASGKGLTFKKDLVLKDDLMETESEDKKLEISGFKTASGKGLTFKKDLVLKDDLMGSESENKNVEISGFKTASGQNLLFKKDLILKDDETHSNETNSLEMPGFKTATGRSLLYKKQNITATPEDSENKPNLIPSLKNEIQTNNQEQHFKPVVIQKPNVSSNRMMDGKKFKRPQLIDKSKLNKYVDSLVNEADTKENLIELKEIDNEHKDQKFNIHIFKHLKKELSYLKVKDLNFVKCELKNVQSEGAQFLKNKNGFNLVRPIFEVVKTEILYPMDLSDNLDLISWENKRQLAYDNLTKRLEVKKQINLKNGQRSKPGYLFEQKKLARESGENIQLESIKLKRDLDLNNLKKINIDDLENFKFNLSEFEDLFELVKTNGFIQASDSGCLVPDKSLQIGFNEIYKL
ncbi:unnamed protein product [Brachionus calyciflorus]|uniref:Uncharacterized protein n=1 Tax=Brachionus calyciflorus TaxID=104777 RepID=A0A813MNE8_9BILA|nr:unnamed protein product [Brachionus calyciflorus]